MVWKEYAHLKPDEKEIAKRWVAKVPIQGRREYDVHLETDPVRYPTYYTQKYRRLYETLYYKRIDLVVHAADAVWIIEVTPKVSKAAVGGCEVYRDLYMKQFKPSKPVFMGIICEVDDPAYHDYLKKAGIRLWVV